MTEHKKTCLKINGEQAVKLEKGTTEFKNYCKQISVPLKVCDDFECILKGVESNAGSCTKNIKISFLVVFLTNMFVLIIDLVNQLFFIEVKILLINLLKQSLKGMNTVKIMKENFKKILFMTEKEEEHFQSSNTCWICEKLIEHEKVRNHCHITEKYRGAAHRNCDINLKFTKKVPVIFHNLNGYDSHFIINEIGKFDVKIDIVPNGSEKYMAFTINKNLIFINSMQFMNSTLEKPVKNLSDKSFKYLTQEFGSENLMLRKQKNVYPYDEYMNSFERFSEEKLSDKKCFYKSLKGGTTDDNGEKLNGYITDEEYLACIKIWDEFNTKNMGDYHDYYLKKGICY